MITTDIKSALKETIKDFYEWSQKEKSGRKYTYIEIKGIFLNKLKSNLKSTSITYSNYNRNIHNIIGVENFNFELVEGKLRGLLFRITIPHNKEHVDLINTLNLSIPLIDIQVIEDERNFSVSFNEKVKQIINNINNFKIPNYV